MRFSLRSSAEQVNLTCDILCICMSNLEIDQASNVSYHCYLERCLQHSNPDVKLLALTDIERRLNHPNGVPFEWNVVIALIGCLDCDETKVSNVAVRVLVKILPNFLTDKECRNLLELAVGAKDLQRCRVYEIAVKLSQTSAENHASVEFILERLISNLIFLLRFGISM